MLLGRYVLDELWLEILIDKFRIAMASFKRCFVF